MQDAGIVGQGAEYVSPADVLASCSGSLFDGPALVTTDNEKVSLLSAQVHALWHLCVCLYHVSPVFVQVTFDEFIGTLSRVGERWIQPEAGGDQKA